jgi:hypothetical protein
MTAKTQAQANKQEENKTKQARHETFFSSQKITHLKVCGFCAKSRKAGSVQTSGGFIF